MTMKIGDRVTVKSEGSFRGMCGRVSAASGGVYAVSLDDGRERGFAGFELELSGPEPDYSNVDPAQVASYKALVADIKAIINSYDGPPADSTVALAELLIRDAIYNGTHGSPGERVGRMLEMVQGSAFEYLDADDPWVVRMCEPSGWRPIESAPQGRDVLVAMIGGPGRMLWAAVARKDSVRWIETGTSIRKPTHWMPLPEPPPD